MRVAVHGAEETEFGLRVATPARMALAHLLEHADPDKTPISNLPGGPARFIKDVGRAISLWWLAREQSVTASETWQREWKATLTELYPGSSHEIKGAAQNGLASIADYLPDAHAIALIGVLAPHGTTLKAYRRAYANLFETIEQL